MNKAQQAYEMLMTCLMPHIPSDLELIKWCKEFNGSLVTTNIPYKWINFDDCSDLVFHSNGGCRIVDISTNDPNYWSQKYIYLTNAGEGIFTVIYDATLAVSQPSVVCFDCMWQGATFVPCSEHNS